MPKLVILSGGVLLLLVILQLYAPVRAFEFLNFDDNVYITENQHVVQGLSISSIRWAFTESHGGHWHPLTWVAHMVDIELFGINAGMHHLVNVLLHACNAMLLYALLLRLFGQYWQSLFIALLFALHPMRIESVAWIAERKDVLSVFFCFCSMHSFVSFVRATSFSRIRFYLLSVGFFLTGLLCKPSIVVLPILLLLLDWWPLARQKKWNDLILEKMPFIAASVLLSCIVLITQEVDGGLKSVASFPLLSRLSNAAFNIWRYGYKLFYPKPLGIFHPFELLPWWILLVSVFFTVIVSIGCFRLRKRCPVLLFAWCWYLVSLAPILGIVQIGGQSHADRWSYLPHIGLLIGLTFYLSDFFSTKKCKSILALCVLALAFVQTQRELLNWKNSATVFKRALQYDPSNYVAHVNYGVTLEKSGKLDQAAYHYNQSLQSRPNYAKALNNLGSVHAQRQGVLKAIPLFSKALEHAPQYATARFNLGLAYYHRNDTAMTALHWLYIVVHKQKGTTASQGLQQLLENATAFSLCQKMQRRDSVLFSQLWLAYQQQLVESEQPYEDMSLDSLFACLPKNS